MKVSGTMSGVKFHMVPADIQTREFFQPTRNNVFPGGNEMEIGASASILNGLSSGNTALIDGGVVSLFRQQALESTRLLVQLYALKAATELQETAALVLIQSALGIGRNVDYVA